MTVDTAAMREMAVYWRSEFFARHAADYLRAAADELDAMRLQLKSARDASDFFRQNLDTERADHAATSTGLQRKLAITIEALEWYANTPPSSSLYTWDKARKALADIRGKEEKT